MNTVSKPDPKFDDVRAQIAKIGARFDLVINDTTRALYEGHLDATPVKVEEVNLAYGTDERHRLDLFSAGGNNLPVVLYVHGGGFIGGDKRATDLFYANVGRYFASRGFLAVTMNYRLASKHGWPAGPEDVSAAVEWLAKNVASHGGDGTRIGLIGQSSGCCHIASYLFDRHTAATSAQRVKAAVLMSGYYRVKPPLSHGQAAYFGDDVALHEERSPAANVSRNTSTPLLLTLAEYDPAAIAQQTLDFASALTASRGACPPVHRLDGHNHVSSALSLGTAQQDVSDLLTAFLHSHVAEPASK